MWCWRRWERISWTNRVRNEEVLHTGEKERNILHTINRKKAKWIGNCFRKQVTEGKIERSIDMTGRRGRRRNQLLGDCQETRRYCKLKEEAVDRTV
jgi:hypothetical protein